MVGSHASAALSDYITTNPTQDDNGEKGTGRDEDGKNGQGEKERAAEEYEDDVIDNVINDHTFVPDQIDLLIDDVAMSSEPGTMAPWPSSSTGHSPSSSHDFNTQVIPMLIVPAAPSESLHQLGISYSLTNYVLQDSGPCPGFFNYTLDILANPLGNTELAQVAIRAAGLAGLASTTGADKIMYKALSGYAEAIAALMDSRMTNNDSTILAVITLGLFETITCSGRKSLETWKHHINDAANLLMHRSTGQFRTNQGVQIFGEAVSHVLTLCSRYGHHIPPRLRFLLVELDRNSARKGPSWMLSTAHIEVMDLYQRVDPDQEIPFLPEEWENLLSHAAELDRRLKNLFAERPVYWCFKTVSDPWADSRVVYHSMYHIYYNTWVAKIWDSMRASRILINQVIYCLLLREGLMWAPHELSDGGAYTTLLQTVSDTTTEMRDGILASVPQMLGFLHHEAAMGTSYLDCSSADMPRLVVPASGPYFLLWYLFLAGSLPINTLEIRAWVVDRLRAIRSLTGIQKADYLADMLETDPRFLSAKLPMNQFLLPNF